ncbi:MAG: gamma-glutamylcyclotransferase [Pseudomonadota bacterium]
MLNREKNLQSIQRSAEGCLATYGTLAPGRANHHQLSELQGCWSKGTVNGTLHTKGWGAEMGFPGIVIDPDGPEVDVDLFFSADLPDHWDRLDAFEGSEYRRIEVTVKTETGPRQAYIYVLIV